MSITEIIPVVRALPRSEKIELARLLFDELAGEELLAAFKQDQAFQLCTPQFPPGTAALLATLLQEQEKKP